MKYLYVVLSATCTVPARLIRFYTRSTYSHASISLRKDLQGMCSFSRKRISNPFDGGFVIESPKTLQMGKDTAVRIKIFEIPVSDDQFEKAESFIKMIQNDKEEYAYNILTFLTGIVGHYSEVYKTFICTSFVVKVLENAGVLPFEIKKKNEVYVPSDIEKMFSDCVYYEGDLRDYAHSKNVYYENNSYFTHIGIYGETKATLNSFKRIAKRYVMTRSLK